MQPFFDSQLLLVRWIVQRPFLAVRRLLSWRPFPLEWVILGVWIAGLNLANGTTLLEQTHWRDLPAWRLTDGHSEAIVVPTLSGRVVCYGRVGGKNLIWTAPPTEAEAKGYRNWGGDKTFVGPHDVWLTHHRTLWPPRSGWDDLPHKADILEGNRLRTIGPVWDGFGIRVVREFSFDDTGQFVIQQTLEKIDGEPQRISVWNVTQVTPPDAVLLSVNPKSPYWGGIVLFNGKEKPSSLQEVSSNLIRLGPVGGTFFKAGADSPNPSLVALFGETAWLIAAEKAKGQYPEGVPGAGLPVTIYNHGDPGQGHYMELETQSPLQTLSTSKNRQISHVVRWSLHELTSSNDDNVRKIQEWLQSQPAEAH